MLKFLGRPLIRILLYVAPVSVINYYQKLFLHSEVNAELVTLLFEKDRY